MISKPHGGEVEDGALRNVLRKCFEETYFHSAYSFHNVIGHRLKRYHRLNRTYFLSNNDTISFYSTYHCTEKTQAFIAVYLKMKPQMEVLAA